MSAKTVKPPVGPRPRVYVSGEGGELDHDLLRESVRRWVYLLDGVGKPMVLRGLLEHVGGEAEATAVGVVEVDAEFEHLEAAAEAFKQAAEEMREVAAHLLETTIANGDEIDRVNADARSQLAALR